MREIYSAKWFHHYMSMDEVIKVLSNQSVGTFLVRFAGSRNDGYALDFVEDPGKIRTVFIKKDPRSVLS